MSKKANNNVEKQKQSKKTDEAFNDPWISMRKGLGIIIVFSVGMALLTFYTIKPEAGFTIFERIGYSLFFGGAIWLVFFGYILLHRFLNRNRR